MSETASPVIQPADQPKVSRVFASAPDEARVRRTADVALVIACTVALVLAGWAVDDSTGPERWLDRIVADAPDWVRTLASATYVAGGLWVLGMTVYLLYRRTRKVLIRDVLVAGGSAAILGIVLARIVADDWPEFLPELDFDGDPSFPVLRIAIASAILLVALPSLTLPMRKLDRWVIAAMSVSAAVLGYGDLTAIVGGLALGIGCAAGTRLLFGTSVGIPTLDRVRACLLEVGVTCTDLDYEDEQPADRLVASARDDVGELQVSVFSRDAANSTRAARLWRAMWYRDARSVLGVSREQQVEHAALALLLGTRGGVPVPELVAVGATAHGDAVLVTRSVPGVPLDRLDRVAIGDDLIYSLWSQLLRLHEIGLSHGLIDPHSIVVAEGLPRFVDLSRGVTAPSSLSKRLDIVEMLVMTALVTTPERAVAAAVRSVPLEDLTSAIGVVQWAALGSDLKKSAKAAELDIDDLRDNLADALDVEAPALAQLRRVRVRDIVMIGLLLIVANAIIGWLADIDLETFVDEVKDAAPAWLVLALFVSQMTNIAETISMTGVVSHRIPFGPTMQFQYAVSYISLAVPSDAGRIGMTIRYLQKIGVPTRIAVGQGPFTTVFGYGIDLLLLLTSAKVIGTDIDLPEDTDLTTFLILLALLVVAVVVGIAVVLIVPKFRNRIVPAVKETVLELKGALTDPKRATMLIGGLLAKKLLFALTLLCVVTAFGHPIGFATAIFVNTAVSWFAGVFPVPGGIGVAEAGFTVGLMAFGVPESAALATAIGHRMLTTYLPPIPGYFAMRNLERNGYL